MAVQYNSGALPPCLAFIWPSQLPADLYGSQDTMNRQAAGAGPVSCWDRVRRSWGSCQLALSEEELGELFVSWQTGRHWDWPDTGRHWDWPEGGKLVVLCARIH